METGRLHPAALHSPSMMAGRKKEMRRHRSILIGRANHFPSGNMSRKDPCRNCGMERGECRKKSKRTGEPCCRPSPTNIRDPMYVDDKGSVRYRVPTEQIADPETHEDPVVPMEIEYDRGCHHKRVKE